MDMTCYRVVLSSYSVNSLNVPVLSRVQAFLPEIANANVELEQKIREGFAQGNVTCQLHATCSMMSATVSNTA